MQLTPLAPSVGGYAETARAPLSSRRINKVQ